MLALSSPAPNVQEVLPLLRTLCSLRWQPALAALLARLAREQQDAAHLLSDLFAAPAEAEAAEVQQVAAQQAAALAEQRASGRAKKAEHGGSTAALLGRCLAALAHPDRGVREAALACAQASAKLLPAADLPGAWLRGRKERLIPSLPAFTSMRQWLLRMPA